MLLFSASKKAKPADVPLQPMGASANKSQQQKDVKLEHKVCFTPAPFHLAQIMKKKHYIFAVEKGFLTKQYIINLCKVYDNRWSFFNWWDGEYEKLSIFLQHKNCVAIIKSNIITWEQLNALDKNTLIKFCNYFSRKDFQETYLRVNDHQTYPLVDDKIQYAVERFEAHLAKTADAKAVAAPSKTHG